MKFIKENKIIASIISLFFVSFLSWGIWVTVSVFAQEKNQAINEKSNQVMIESTKEVKQEIRIVKEDIKELNKKIDINQNQMVEILLDVKKSVKK